MLVSRAVSRSAGPQQLVANWLKVHGLVHEPISIGLKGYHGADDDLRNHHCDEHDDALAVTQRDRTLWTTGVEHQPPEQQALELNI